MRRQLTLATVTAVAALALAACSSEGNTSNNQTSTTKDAPTGDHNAADVEFAQGMIPHHAQALRMVQMTEGRDDLDSAFRELTEDIRAAQAPEIEVMSEWLEDWGEAVPDTYEGHAGGHGPGDTNMGSDMPGMMDEDDFAALDGAGPSTFENMWLSMMIEHHEGAVDMAQRQQQDGAYPPAVDLAEQIEADQAREIRTMQRLMDS